MVLATEQKWPLEGTLGQVIVKWDTMYLEIGKKILC